MSENNKLVYYLIIILEISMVSILLVPFYTYHVIFETTNPSVRLDDTLIGIVLPIVIFLSCYMLIQRLIYSNPHLKPKLDAYHANALDFLIIFLVSFLIGFLILLGRLRLFARGINIIQFLSGLVLIVLSYRQRVKMLRNNQYIIDSMFIWKNPIFRGATLLLLILGGLIIGFIWAMWLNWGA